MTDLSFRARPLRGSAPPDFVSLAADLCLTRGQLPAWRAFAEAFVRTAHDHQKISAIIARNSRDRAPGLPASLKMHVQTATVALDAARRLEAAIEGARADYRAFLAGD